MGSGNVAIGNPWGAVIGGGLGLVSSLLGSHGAHAAARAEQERLQQQRQEILKQYGQFYPQLNPYTHLGSNAADHLNELSSPDGQANFLRNYYNSDAYDVMANQAQGSLGAMNEAGGRSAYGGAGTPQGNYLARIAPMLGQQALAHQQQLYGSEIPFGLQALGMRNPAQELGLLGQNAAGQASAAGQAANASHGGGFGVGLQGALQGAFDGFGAFGGFGGGGNNPGSGIDYNEPLANPYQSGNALTQYGNNHNLFPNPYGY